MVQSQAHQRQENRESQNTPQKHLIQPHLDEGSWLDHKHPKGSTNTCSNKEKHPLALQQERQQSKAKPSTIPTLLLVVCKQEWLKKFVKNEMINRSYKGLGMTCLLHVFLHFLGSPKWLFSVSYIEEGFKCDPLHSFPLWRKRVHVLYLSGCSLCPLEKSSFLSQYSLANSIHSAPSRDTIIGF